VVDRKLFGSANANREVGELNLSVRGKNFCTKCGAPIESQSFELPDEVGAVVLMLIRHCQFCLRSIELESGEPSVWLQHNHSAANFKSRVRWRYYPLAVGAPTLGRQDQLPPDEVGQTHYVLSDRGFVLGNLMQRTDQRWQSNLILETTEALSPDDMSWYKTAREQDDLNNPKRSLWIGVTLQWQQAPRLPVTDTEPAQS
jgi:hypothetical protein